MSRRNQIELSPDEVADFLATERTMICASNGRDGWPHLMPLWYVPRGEEIWAWTYAKSQKVRNLERDDRCTLQLETGDSYEQLRGVMIKARVTIERDLEVVAQVGQDVAERYGSQQMTPEVRAAMRKQAAKRVALRFTPISIASWDHRKLGGGY